MRIKIFCLFLILFVNHLLKAQDLVQKDTVAFTQIHDLSNDWQVYDNRYQDFVPFVSSEHSRSNKICFWLDTHVFKDYYLHLYSERDIFLFVNNKLVATLPKKHWSSYSIDSISNVYTKKPFITLYSKGAQRLLKTEIGSKLHVNKVIVKDTYKKKNYPQKLSKDTNNDVLIIIFWAVLVFIAILMNLYPNTFAKFLRFENMLVLGKMEENPFVNKPFTSVNIIFLLGFILTSTLIYWMIMVYYMPGTMLWVGILDRSPEKISWVFQTTIVLFGVLLVMLLKYLVIYILSFVFSMQKISNYHYYESVRVSWWFYGVASIILTYIVLSLSIHIDIAFEILKYTLLCFFILRTLYLTIHLNKAGSFRNLYLISYICASEIIPLVFYSKVILFK